MMYIKWTTQNLAKKILPIRLSNNPTRKVFFGDYMKTHAYAGPVYDADKTDDELLYGGNFEK